MDSLQHFCPVDSGQGMMSFSNVGHTNRTLAQQSDQPLNESGAKEGNIARRNIRGLDSPFEYGQASGQSLKGSAAFLLVANNLYAFRQRRKFLSGSCHNHDGIYNL